MSFLFYKSLFNYENTGQWIKYTNKIYISFIISQSDFFYLLLICINYLNDLLQGNAEKCIGSSLERVLTGVMCHIGQKPCTCSDTDPRYSFSLQILTIPFLWHVFPNLRQVFIILTLFDGGTLPYDNQKLKERHQ